MRQILLLAFLFSTVWAIPVKSLIEQGVSYDGKTVSITGEVIGDILYRKDCVWINVLSPEGTAIGIKTTLNAIQKIQLTGNYRQRGDTVSVSGVFYRFNRAELGETMILAKDINVLAPGQKTSVPVTIQKAGTALLLLLISLGLSLLYAQPYFKPQKNTSNSKF
jgi:hypothetical protein